MQQKSTQQTSASQLIALVVIAVVLAAGYIVLDMYSDGEKYVAMTESRGAQVTRGLSQYKLESGNYPDSLAKLAPKFLASVPGCPAGEAFAYALAGGEYTLTCQKVMYRMKPYTYDSRSKAWRG